MLRYSRVVHSRVVNSRVFGAPVWSSLQQSVVDAAVSEWRKRLQACVRVKGGHFEHLLYAVSIAE